MAGDSRSPLGREIDNLLDEVNGEDNSQEKIYELLTKIEGAPERIRTPERIERLRAVFRKIPIIYDRRAKAQVWYQVEALKFPVDYRKAFKEFMDCYSIVCAREWAQKHEKAGLPVSFSELTELFEAPQPKSPARSPAALRPGQRPLSEALDGGAAARPRQARSTYTPSPRPPTGEADKAAAGGEPRAAGLPPEPDTMPLASEETLGPPTSRTEPPKPATTDSTDPKDYISPDDAFDLAEAGGVDEGDFAYHMGLVNPTLHQVSGVKGKVYSTTDIKGIIARASGKEEGG
jgi:hypothetical protein